MCGIIAYIGHKPVVPVLIAGLRRLEYRGYDSAGVALVHDGSVEIRRSAGKLSQLEATIATQPVDGDYGLGHTRWATHGRPTEENAHPHQDCTGRVVVVHFRNIERPFLDAAVKARRGEGVLFPMIDTMSLEARWHRQTLWARFRRWLGRPPVSIRLNASRERYGLPVYQGHHALIDALATAELLQAQIANRYSPETPLKALWC